jgi:putative ABC transport system permease protein
MRTVVAAQLRHRVGRTLALLAGIVAAVTSFTVLTGTTEVSRLVVVGAVEENFRNVYDILVRPRGSTSELEVERDMVRNNFLSGLGGGISLDQYEEILGTDGVDVAAPIAMLGYQGVPVLVEIPLDPYIGPDPEPIEGPSRQVFRIRTALTTDRGLSTFDGSTRYAYFTANPMTHEPTSSSFQPYEEVGRGQRIAVCPEIRLGDTSLDRDQAAFECFSSDDRREDIFGRSTAGSYVASFEWPVAYVVAAIDPEQEARLAGLDEAVVDGRYLRSTDRPSKPPSGSPTIDVPVLLSTELMLDEQLGVVVERLPAAATTEMLGGLDSASLEVRLDHITGQVVDRLSFDTTLAHEQFVDTVEELAGGGRMDPFVPLASRWTTSLVDYEQVDDDRLRPRPVVVATDRWVTQEAAYPFNLGQDIPWSAGDVGFRVPEVHAALEPSVGWDLPAPRIVGRFDPTQLPTWSELSAVPMEAYSPPGAVGWDARTRELLGDRSLQPSSSPTGYLASPPMLLTPLSSLDLLLDPEHFTNVDREAPISAIRVRVGGVTGVDEESRERIRVVAEEIAERTGLDVDVTIGSSPVPQRVDLEAGQFGRPELSLREQWVQKGVAVAILDAVDRKSAVLFGLILMVCGLALANAGAAAVRARRAELAVLACLGWSSRKLYGAVLAELLVVGLLGGVVAALLSPLLALAFDVEVPAGRALAAIGAALVLALLAGLWPAFRASRAQPASAVRPAVLTVRRTRQPRRIVGLALANLLRVPARTLLGALSLAIGVAALTLVLAATVAFHEDMVGSLLGEAISVEVRDVDYVAVATVLALGTFAVGDVLYLNVRDRAAEFAALQASGWTEGQLARLVTWEGLLVGLLGSAVGAATGLVAVAQFAGDVPAGLWTASAGAVLAGAVLAAVAATVAARVPARLPIAMLLAEE